MLIGDLGESKDLHEFVKLEIPVSIPFGNNLPYDLVIDCCGRLYKVQVKTISRVSDSGVLNFELSQSVYLRNICTSNDSICYSLEDVDLFFLYCVETDDCILIENKDTKGMKSISFRHKDNPPKNGQTQGVHFVEDYSVLKTFDRMGYILGGS